MVISGPAADFTRYKDIRQEVHLNLYDAVTITVIAASALDIEAEPALLVPSHLGFRHFGKEVSYVSEMISVDDPATEFTLSSEHSLGSFIETRSKHAGYVAKLWKVVTVDGVEKERTQVNKSTYKASCRKVTVGIAGATEEQIAAIKKAIEKATETKEDYRVKSVIDALVASPDSDID